ncbi:MAG: hypothetical protein BGO63_19130 [Candidatus Accumulibacter sp. 66-26]|nr:MAG: hypothetical protein BGO63_19130 [Candidatus Accumulibacter sp. 66-26]
MQADKPDELMSGLALSGPEAPTSFFDEQLATIGYRVTLCAREHCGEILHDSWVCIHRGEGLTISKLPLA